MSDPVTRLNAALEGRSWPPNWVGSSQHRGDKSVGEE